LAAAIRAKSPFDDLSGIASDLVVSRLLTEVADLKSALAGQHEQLDDRSIFAVAGGLSNLDQLTLCQYTISNPLWGPLMLRVGLASQ